MRFFHFKNLGQTEAFIFASDAERASELFVAHAQAVGGDTEAILWRELEPQHFVEPFRAYLVDGLELEQEGVAFVDTQIGTGFPAGSG